MGKVNIAIPINTIGMIIGTFVEEEQYQITINSTSCGSDYILDHGISQDEQGRITEVEADIPLNTIAISVSILHVVDNELQITMNSYTFDFEANIFRRN